MRDMSIKLFLVLTSCILLTGCPPASWLIKPNIDSSFPVTESCVRSVGKIEGVIGIVQLDFDRTDDRFERYLIETDYGVANLDLEFRNGSAPIVHLYLYGSGVNPPPKATNGGQEFLNKIIHLLRQSCAKNS